MGQREVLTVHAFFRPVMKRKKKCYLAKICRHLRQDASFPSINFASSLFYPEKLPIPVSIRHDIQTVLPLSDWYPPRALWSYLWNTVKCSVNILETELHWRLKIRPIVCFRSNSTHVFILSAPTHFTICIRGLSIPLFSFINRVGFSCQ